MLILVTDVTLALAQNEGSEKSVLKEPVQVLEQVVMSGVIRVGFLE